MKVIIYLEDSVYGKTQRTYDFPGLKRRFAMYKAIDRLRMDYSARMYDVAQIRTIRD